MDDENLSEVQEIDDLDDLTEAYPSDSELINTDDIESLTGDEVDDSWLDSDGDGIPDYLDDDPTTKTVHVEGELEITEGGN